MDLMQQVIYKSRYAKYLDEQKRRENWEETVERYIQNVVVPRIEDTGTIDELRKAISNMEVMPSMRAMMTAGPAMDRCNVASYNCSYLPMNHPRAFDEKIGRAHV